MSGWWLLAGCAAAPPRVLGADWRATEAGRYRVRTEVGADGSLTTWVADRRGRPVVDAWVRVELPGRSVLDDPGECDAVGEQRCTHPSGAYEARIVGAPDGAGFASGFRVRIDGPDGTDAVAVPDVR